MIDKRVGKIELFECTLCPCRFFIENDLERHMQDFGDDPAEHLSRFMRGKNLSSVNRRDLRMKYLESG